MRLVRGSAFLCLASLPVVAAGAQPRAGETLESRALWRTAGDVHVAIGCGGVSVEPSSTLAPHGAAWKLALRTRALGRAGVRVDVGDPFVELRERDAVLRFDGCTEWFARDARGVEHGWTITMRPAGDATAPLEIGIEADGLVCEISADGRDALFVDERGAPRVRYEHLRAWDALGRELPARIALDELGLSISVDDRDASYPITVDPLLGGAVWIVDGPTGIGVTAFGARVASAGDVNADGFDDVVLGAPYLENGEFEEGRAYLYLGGPGGLSTTPAWTFEPNLVGAHVGSSVDGAGDVNGDGYDDVVIGANACSNGESQEGCAFLFRGTPSGLESTPSWTAESNQATAFFGTRVAGAGDVDGNGYDDVVVSAVFFDTTLTDAGRVFLYRGSSSGLAASPAWTYSGSQADEWLGASLACAGDVDGDGRDDVVVGTPYYNVPGASSAGRALLFRGTASGLTATPAWTAVGSTSYALMGAGVAGAGDVDRDGRDDVIVGAPGLSLNTGGAFVYRGVAGGLATTPVWSAPTGASGDFYGFVVGGAGDTDGDGYDDVIVAALYLSNGQTQEGRAYAFRGTPAGPAPVAEWSAEGDDAYAHFGASIGGQLDINGDGLSDLVIGTHYFTPTSLPAGRAFAFHGVDESRICAGDGSASACPCGNFGAPGNGCANSSNAAGGRLDRVGFASVAADTFALFGTNMPNTTALYFQGSADVAGGSGVAFGDGLRCAGGTVVRLGTKTNVGGASSYPTGGDLPISVRGHVAPGDVRVYQLWYRNAAAYCTPETFNFTNAIRVTWL